MEKEQLVCSSEQCYSTLAGFGKEFLSKEQRGNTVASPIITSPGSRSFLPVPWNEISIAGTALCEVTGIIQNVKEELKRFSQYGFEECVQQFYRRW
jgi:hypothetical protein